jgi:hypothetical protein
MTSFDSLMIASAAVAALYIVLRPAAAAYLTFRGTRVVTCPETKAPAAVEVDAKRAALTVGLAEPELRLSHCSRWPERQDCAQECVAQILSAPEDCLVRTIVTEWYRGKSCALCRQPFGEIQWHERQPALIGPERRTRQWSEVAAERLPEVLSTHRAVCWSCHIAETFRREYPDLVVDRQGRREQSSHVAG